MQSYTESILHSKGGGPAVGVSVRVNVRGTNTLAVLYSDNGVTTLPNPTVTDELGTFKFYAANGRYDIILSGAALKKPALISDVNLYDPADAPLLLNPAFKNQPVTPYMSGRVRNLSAFPFEAVYADGNHLTASEVRALYPNGIPGVLERVDDGSIAAGSNSTIPVADRKVWKFSILPTHKNTGGHPRTQVWGHPLKQRTHYRIPFAIRPQHNTALGWNSTQTDLPYGSIFVLSQQGSGSTSFSPGQLNSAASPLYIMMDGTYIYPELRVIAEESAQYPTDPGATLNYTPWDIGDTERVCMRKKHGRVLDGNLFHEIILEVFLDDRPRRLGGQGYFRATFDGEPWFDHTGPTSLPPNAEGKYADIQPRWGLYDNVGVAKADGTLVTTSDNNAYTVERSLLFKFWGAVEVTP